MTDATTRRTYLLAVVTNIGTTVMTKHAAKIYDHSPWRVSKRTARRDLLALAHAGYLIPLHVDGLRAFGLSDGPGRRPRLRDASRQQVVLHVMNRDGGEWTVGRLKPVYRRVVGSHVYPTTIRRDLAELHKRGHIVRHGDGTPRRYYTPTGDAR